MKVKELILQLQRLDKEQEVFCAKDGLIDTYEEIFWVDNDDKNPLVVIINHSRPKTFSELLR